MTQWWRGAVFAHWPVPVDDVARLLPASLEPDVHDGRAWVSLVGFHMDGLRMTGLPLIPSTSSFAEFNVRTYVVGPDGPGVWFCSLDVEPWLPVLVARAAFALPYDKGRVVGAVDDAGHTRWEIARTWPGRSRGSMVVEPIDDEPADAALDDFLTARWRLYAATRSGRVLTAPVEHPPWTLRAGRLVSLDPGLAQSAGFTLEGTPVVHLADDVPVRVGRPRLLARRRAERITVWFDDDCGLCSTSVRWLSGVTGADVEWRANRELDDPALLRRSGDALLVTDGAHVAAGVDAVVEVLSRARRAHRVAAWMLRLPGVHALASVVYRVIAANRSRISARLGLASGCDLPASRRVDA